MPLNLALAAVLAAASAQVQPATTAEQPVAVSPAQAVEPAADAAPAAPTKLILPKGTMVRLMVLKEVNSRDNKPGDRFVLRVDEDVRVHGTTVVPIGTKAWGEVTALRATGGAGKSGRISARLLYLDVAGEHIDLDGERASAGTGAAGTVVGAVVAFGLFGLFAKGNNATIKAGEILNGYTIADASFDPPPLAQ
jgi:hypothetical protein